jgi:P4 family phage/plasmid primase-like protien
MGNIASVRNLLQGRSEMVVREVDFDAHPHLLNTPLGVVDLRTGARDDHDPALLLRQITLYGPDIGASTWMNGRDIYEQRCPLFFKVLRNVATGREWVIPAIRAWFAYCLTGDLRHQALMFMHGPPGVGKTQIVEVLFALLNTYALLIDESFLSKNGGEAKRFDIANIVGKRMLFMDETQLGMTWDETRASKGASAKKLSAEIKFGRTIQFCNTAKICIVGNHKPNFVAAETGGLTSRMLLFEAQGIDYRDPKNGGTDNLADIIVRDEGPAVMMWALEACVADYGTPGLFSELTAEPREAARQYAQEDSTIRQWADDLMRVTPDADIDQMEAFRGYLSFAKEISSSGEAPNIKLSGFKQALKATFPSIEFANRTKGLHKNRVFIKGFGFQRPDFSEAGNVVQLAAPASPKPAQEK